MVEDKEIIEFANKIKVNLKSHIPAHLLEDIDSNSITELGVRYEQYIKNLRNRTKPSDKVERKFEEIIEIDEWEVETHKGFVDIKSIGKTVPYEKWKLITDNHELECADTHIVIDSEWDEIFVMNLNKDSRPDKIVTENGLETVKEVYNTGIIENMYDLQLGEGSDSLYYTNGILSHNSIFLANDAANFIKMGMNVAFITLEMADYKVVKRIGANLLGIPMSEYDKVAQDEEFMKRKLDKIGMGGILPPGHLVIKQFPTSQATIMDVENFLKEYEEVTGIKIQVVVLDYINIMCNHRNPNSENTYMKIKQLAEDLRGLAVRQNLLIVTATQTNRSGWDSSDIKMENIAESAGLSHTCDLILGIIQDSTMNLDQTYWLKVLKIRDGEGKGTKCKFKINYNYMKLSETSETTVVSDF